ncbi:MAG: Bax inhibitor-1/YccA family membrane protein, partial [Flavobacteriales bacterium]
MSKRGFLSSSNPFLNENAIEKKSKQFGDGYLTDDLFVHMTAQGATNKSIALGLILVAFAFIGYSMGNTTILIAGAILGLGTAIFAMVKPKFSPILAPLYAIFEGLFVGCVTLNYSMMFEGIVGNAIVLTMALFFTMLFLYKAKIIKVTQKFRSIVIMATLG